MKLNDKALDAAIAAYLEGIVVDIDGEILDIDKGMSKAILAYIDSLKAQALTPKVWIDEATEITPEMWEKFNSAVDKAQEET